jgi:PAS domain S-box-containing protein
MSNSTYFSGESSPDVATRALVEAIAHLDVALAVVDRSGKLLFQNASMDTFAHRGDGAWMPEGLLRRALETGEDVVEAEHPQPRPGGRRAPVRWTVRPVRDDAGLIVAAVISAAEVDLDQEQLAYLQQLLENTDDAVVGTDAEFRVTVWSPGAERLYGYRADEVFGRYAREVASFAGDESRLELEAELLEFGRSRSVITAVRKDGQEVEVDLISLSMRNARGDIVAYLGIHRDVTERRLLDREQEQLVAIVRNSGDFIAIADMDGIPSFVNDAGRQMVGLGDLDLSKTHVLDYFAPESRDFVQDEVLPLIREQGRWPAVTELKLRDWSTEAAIPVLFDAFRIDDPQTGEPIAMATVTRDISERKNAERESELRARQQAAVASLGLRALAEDGGIDPLIDEAVRLVAEVFDVRYASVAEVINGDEVLLRAGTSLPAHAAGALRAPAGRETFAGYTLLAAEPVVSDDVTSDERFTLGAILDTSTPKSGVGVVIPGRDEPFGALTVFCEHARTFTGDDVDFLQSVASVLAIAIERTRTEQRVHGARRDERRRLARSLHDEALQELAAAAARSEGNHEMQSAISAVGEHLRAAIYDLRLGDEQDRPLPELLQALVEVHAAIADGYEIDLEIEDGAPSGSLEATGVEVVRILGEALTNVRRHASARHVRVRVWGGPGRLCAEVIDDGRGTAAEPAKLGAAGNGIATMRERAALIDGELDIRSGPDGGTTVHLEVPLDGAGASDAYTRVLLVEDHTAVRQALAAALERDAGISVVAQASTLAEARAMLDYVDVAVLDLGLPDGFGADLVTDLRAANRDSQALVLSATLDRDEIARAVDRGAAGVLDKTTTLQEVVRAVKRLRAGETLLPPAEVTELLRLAREADDRERDIRARLEDITEREREVLQLLADGLNTQEISARLHISPRTHRNHVASILQKLGVHSQLQAVLLGLRYGEVQMRAIS